jgi:hypothetical protein
VRVLFHVQTNKEDICENVLDFLKLPATQCMCAFDVFKHSTKCNAAHAQSGKKGAAHAQPPRSLINCTRGKTKKAVNHANGKIRRDGTSYIRRGEGTLLSSST